MNVDEIIKFYDSIAKKENLPEITMVHCETCNEDININRDEGHEGHIMRLGEKSNE